MKAEPETNQSQHIQSFPEDRAMSLGSDEYGLLTDLYQLTMTACYVGEGIENKPASFELFARKLPQNFGYLIAMGLTQALEYLENLRFSASQIENLQSLEIFNHVDNRFWSLLATGKFTGDVWAIPEGSAVFPHEPMLRVEAPLWQAQIVETYLLNTLNYQTLIATRSARMRDAAGPEAKLLEFGTRRAFSPQASLWAARAALAAGFDGTSNVLAALKLGQKPMGTMAHALVMAIAAIDEDEDAAFEAFNRYFPGAALLIDTYDTVKAAQRLGQKVKKGEMQLQGIRLDSGDLVELSKQVRSLLPEVAIFVSGDIDEGEIVRLRNAEAPINGYGIGTKLVSGHPVNGVYKLVEVDGMPVMKESSGKVTYPGRKQIYRTLEQGKIKCDRLSLIDETEVMNQPAIGLLQLVMKNGQLVNPPECLGNISQRTAASVASLPLECRRFDNPNLPKLEISPGLEDLTKQVSQQVS